MKSDHVIRAIEALADGDRERAMKLVDAIAAEESAANRMTVASPPRFYYQRRCLIPQDPGGKESVPPILKNIVAS